MVNLMDEGAKVSTKKTFSVELDPDDYEALARVVKRRRSNFAQVVREYIVSGIEQDRRIAALLESSAAVAP